MGGGPPGFRLGFTCPVLLGIPLGRVLISDTGLSPSLAGLSRPFPCQNLCYVVVPQPQRASSLVWAFPRSLATTCGISDLIYTPPGTEMFHFPGYHAKRSILFNRRRRAVARRISPFRNLGIKVCLPLPQAYRSLPRLSSSCNAKASSVRPFTLDRASKSNSKTRSRFFALHFLLLQNPL